MRGAQSEAVAVEARVVQMTGNAPELPSGNGTPLWDRAILANCAAALPKPRRGTDKKHHKTGLGKRRALHLARR